ncbi:hypothetical protein FACS1894198_3480 [Clostridia bacterium]|nr:hypothetical protein FACS1894198_3480 [Clostridia bacterium]
MFQISECSERKELTLNKKVESECVLIFGMIGNQKKSLDPSFKRFFPEFKVVCSEYQSAWKKVKPPCLRPWEKYFCNKTLKTLKNT